MLQDLKEKWPGYGVEGLRNVDFEQNARVLPRVHPTTVKLYRTEVIVDPPSFYERSLIMPHQPIHELCESHRKTLRHKLAEAMD
jgi:hypothetical protein